MPCTILWRCSLYRGEESVCPYRNQDLQVWLDCLLPKYSLAWYLCGRYLFYAWIRLREVLGTYKTLFSGRWAGFSYFWDIHTCSYPLVRKLVQACLLRGMRTAGLVVESLNHFYYIFVWGEDVKGLDFLQFFYFLKRIELFLHALDGDVLARLEGESCEHYRESTTALFELKFVLVHPL